MKVLDRRHAIRQLVTLFGAAPFLGAQQADDPVLEPANVMDFAPLAKAKLDPIAWDYLEGGSEDEVSLHDNRAAFNKIIIRPRALVSMKTVDLSLELFGQKLAYPIMLDPAGGKNCFYPGAEVVVAEAAAKAKALHITNGGIQKVVESGKGPVHFQLTTGGELRNTQTMKTFVKRLENSGCSGICLSTDIMFVSHRDRNIHNKFERGWCEVGIPKRDANGKLPRSKNPERAAIYPERAFPTPGWDNLKELCSLTRLPVLVKGILRAEDARLCVSSGAKGVLELPAGTIDATATSVGDLVLIEDRGSPRT
jgi:isopentenyl diphosphate isomerase/L-lactate dehydrogenase-like FMN-dependent dehydrogenase